MFRLVAHIHFSDIDCVYYDNVLSEDPYRILTMSVNGVATIVDFASWVIDVLAGCRHPLIRYWQPLLAKTQGTWSLRRPENERQRCVNNFMPHILGYLFSDWLQTAIHQILATFASKKTSDMLPAAS
jgi:hypothetical protein